jgi:hypothetical protein
MLDARFAFSFGYSVNPTPKNRFVQTTTPSLSIPASVFFVRDHSNGDSLASET